MRLRWNILYLITLAFCFVGYLTWLGGLPGELLGGLAGGLITLVAAVARELIEDKPSPSARIAELYGNPAALPTCSRCDTNKETANERQGAATGPRQE